MVKYVTSLLAMFCISCQSQTIDSGRMATPSAVNLVGGPCEICDLFFVDLPDHITARDTSPAWTGFGSSLTIEGKVFQSDGRTP
ncbi:MAG: hypothetical protein OEQ53_21750, partial [Saprospiraceae bacterium]|nr:hypothetical protein [Saprospiraceae bacterium]